MPTTVGLFGVAVQIEDFLTPASTTPLSSIPLQFLFEVIEGDGTCVDAPVYDATVLPVESCIGVSPGSTFTTRITAIVSTPTRRYTVYICKYCKAYSYILELILPVLRLNVFNSEL